MVTAYNAYTLASAGHGWGWIGAVVVAAVPATMWILAARLRREDRRIKAADELALWSVSVSFALMFAADFIASR
jgi:hypothetical protein